MKKIVFALISLLAVFPCTGKTIIVDCNGSGDFVNIQDAIDDSYTVSGDTIIVKPGTYSENVVFSGLPITLTGENPDDPNIVQATIITAGSGYSVTFNSNEEPNTILTGFTIIGRGINCNSTSPTISKNIIRDCSSWGIKGSMEAAPVISENMISSNDNFGIYLCNGIITKNTISGNQGGIGFCTGQINDNIIQSNFTDYGGGLCHCGPIIVNNVIENNTAIYDGGGLWECGESISNNVIAGNQAGGAGGGLFNCSGIVNHNIIAGNRALNGGGMYNCGADTYNNTIVGNIADNRGGALNLCNGSVYNNIIAFNEAFEGGGVYASSSTSYNDFWSNGDNFAGGSAPGTGDISYDPLFAVEGYWDSNGTPGTFDDFWVDGDYHLRSQAGRWNPVSKIWTFDGETSPCIDAGYPASDWTEELWPHGELINMGVYGGTTQASMSLSNKNNVANLTDEPEPNDWVDYADLKLFTDKWLCVVDEFPLAEDLDRDGVVDFFDFSIFGINLRPEPPKPPEPDPMIWATPPYAISPYSIAMEANIATSTDGSTVEYYFQCASGGGHNSDWQDEPNYTDIGLIAETEYGYKVKARNKENLMETGWSEILYATTLIDSTAPQPDPAEWQEEPNATSSTSIRMVARDANDPSGVQYYFECTECFVNEPPEANDPNLYSSDWQDSSIYEVTDLPKGVYSFVVRARDLSPRYNTTGDSNEVTVDLKPPTPDPMQWAPGGEPRLEHIDPNNIAGWGAVMTAAEATDDSGVEYKFICSNSDFSSGGEADQIYGDGVEWRNEDNVPGDPRTYTIQIGTWSYARSVTFRVKARDRSPNHNTTAPSSPPLKPQ